MMTKAYVCTKNVISVVKEKLVSKVKNSNGMEMLQMIIIVGIAVAIGAAAYVLFSDTFTSFSNSFTNKTSNMFSM